MPFGAATITAPADGSTLPNTITQPKISCKWDAGTGPYDIAYTWDDDPTFANGNGRRQQSTNTGITVLVDEEAPPAALGLLTAGTVWYLQVVVTDTGAGGPPTSTDSNNEFTYTDPDEATRHLYLLKNIGVAFHPDDEPAGGWGTSIGGTQGADGHTRDFERFLYLIKNVGVGFEPTDTPTGGWGADKGGNPLGADGRTRDFERFLYLLENVTNTQPCPYIFRLDPPIGRVSDSIIIRGQGLVSASSPTADAYGAVVRLYETPSLSSPFLTMSIVTYTAGEFEDTIVAQIPAGATNGHVAVIHTSGATCPSSNFAFLTVLGEVADLDAGWWVEAWELDGSAQKIAGPLPAIRALINPILNDIGSGSITLPSYIPTDPDDPESANLLDVIVDPDGSTKPWSLLRVYIDGILRYSFYARRRSKSYGPPSEQMVEISGDGIEWIMSRGILAPSDYPSNPIKSPDILYGSTANAIRNGNLEAGGDPVPNGGFELGTHEPWEPIGSAAYLADAAAFVSDNGVQRTGGFSLKMIPKVAGDGGRVAVPVEPGLRYFFEGWCRDTISAGTVTFFCHYLNDAGSAVTLDSEAVVLSTTWKTAVLVADIPDAVTEVFIEWQWTSGTVHAFWVDDHTGAGAIEPWQTSGDAVARLSNTTFLDGRFSLEVVTAETPAGATIVFQVQPNTRYTIRVPISAESGDDIRLHGVIGDNYHTDDVVGTGVGNWVVAEIVGMTLDETVLRIVVDSLETAPQTFYIDQATATPGNDAASAGTMISDALLAAQARGWGVPIFWTFTATLDANGETWAALDLSMAFQHGISLDEMLDRIVSVGPDWELTDFYELRLVNRLGIDWTLLGPDAPVIREGIPIKEGDISGEVPRHTWVFAEGSGGRWTTGARPEWDVAGLGHLEQFVINGGALTEGTLSTLAQTSLDEEDARGISLKLVLSRDTDLRPFVHFDIGDTVWVDLIAEGYPRDSYRVRSITARLDGEGTEVSYTIDLNRIEYDEDQAVAEALARILEGGEQTVGSGTGIIGVGSSPAASGSGLVVPATSAPVSEHFHRLTDLTDRAVGGDLAGTLPNPVVRQIQGKPLALGPPVNRDMWYYDGTSGGWVFVGGTKAAGKVPTIQSDGTVQWQATSGGSATVPRWVSYLAARQAGETTHADDDFFAAYSGYTEVDPTGTTTWGASNVGLSAVFDSQTANDICGAVKAVASGPPVTIETAIYPGLDNSANPTVGLAFAEGTAVGDDMYGIGLLMTSGLTIWRHQGPWNAVGAAALSNTAVMFYLSPLFLRMIWKSANTWAWAVSPDGTNWTDYGGSDQSFTMTPTHMGFFVSSWSQTTKQVVGFSYLRVYEADLSV